MKKILTVLLMLVACCSWAQLTVSVDGVGPDQAGVLYAKLSDAVAYVNANSSVPNVINVTTNAMEDDAQIEILVPMTINGDGEATPDGTPCDVLVKTNSTDGIGAATDIGQTGKNYIEIAADGAVAINDLILHPDAAGNLADRLIDAVATYKPASGTGNYVLTNVAASASDGSDVYQEPEGDTDIYYATGVKRWYAYGNTRGIFNLTDDGGAGVYDVALTNCKAGAARSHNLRIANTSGTTTVTGGVYAYSGQTNVRIDGATGVTFTGTPSNRVKVTDSTRSSGGEGLQVVSGTVTLIEYVDAIDNGNGASGLAFYDGTVDEVRFCRVAGSAGSDIYFAGGATVTSMHDVTSHGNANPVSFNATWSGTANFTDCIFTSDALGQVNTSTTGTTNFDYCALPTDAEANESLNTTNPFANAPTANTNAISVSPQYGNKTFDKTVADNPEFLRPSNTAYATASSTSAVLAGGAGENRLPVTEWSMY